jgi:hypothetical protein
MNNPFAEQITNILEKELSEVDKNLKSLDSEAMQALLHADNDTIIGIVSALRVMGEYLNSSVQDLDSKVDEFTKHIIMDKDVAESQKGIYRKPILERIKRIEEIMNHIKRAISS